MHLAAVYLAAVYTTPEGMSSVQITFTIDHLAQMSMLALVEVFTHCIVNLHSFLAAFSVTKIDAVMQLYFNVSLALYRLSEGENVGNVRAKIRCAGSHIAAKCIH